MPLSLNDQMNKTRKWAGPVIGILLSLVFLWLALSNVKLNDVSAALANADYRLVLLAGVFTFGSYVFRTARWARLLQPHKQIPIPRLLPVLVIGFALNNLLPARPGEFARAISLGQREGLSKTLGLATIVVERVVDGLTLIAILVVLSVAFELPGWGRQVEVVSTAIFVVALAGLLFLLWREQLATQILNRVIGLLPDRFADKLNGMFSSFILGLHSLRSPRDIGTIFALSLGAWLCETTHYLLILSAFGLIPDIRLRLLAAAFTMVIVNLSIAIPAAPGGVGPFEWAGSLALGVFGIASGSAVSAVLVAHTMQYVLVTGLGFFFTAREGTRLTQAIKQVE